MRPEIIGLKDLIRIAKLLLLWHQRKAAKIFREKAAKKDFDMPDYMADYYSRLDEFGKMNLQDLDNLRAVLESQVMSHLERYYQSIIWELIRETRPNADLVNIFGHDHRLGAIAGQARAILNNIQNEIRKKEEKERKEEQERKQAEANQPSMVNPPRRHGDLFPSMKLLRRQIVKIPSVLSEKCKPYDVHLVRGVGGGKALLDINMDLGSGGAHDPGSFLLKDVSGEDGIVKQVIEGAVIVSEVKLGKSHGSTDVELTVTNPGENQTDVEIPSGTVFEVADNQRVQNLAIAESRRINLAAKERTTLSIPGLCLNKRRATPSGQKGRLTVLRYYGENLSQDAIWRQMGNPANL